MPITSKRHLTIVLRPYPGSRFTIMGSEVHLECTIAKARENLNWLREWLDVNVEPEVQTIEEEAAERNKPRPMFHKGVPTNKPPKPKLSVPTIAQQRHLERNIERKSLEPIVPRITTASQKVTTRQVPPMVQAGADRIGVQHSGMQQTEMFIDNSDTDEYSNEETDDTEIQETSE